MIFISTVQTVQKRGLIRLHVLGFVRQQQRILGLSLSGSTTRAAPPEPISDEEVGHNAQYNCEFQRDTLVCR